MSDVSSNGSFAKVHSILNDDNPKIIPYIRSGNVGETFINSKELEFISKEAHLQLPKSTTKLNDIMMARKGKIGGASIITKNEVNYNCNENVIKLTIKDKEFNPYYFTVYFNSLYGLKQIERISTGNVQPWVSIFQIRKLLIPKLNNEFQLNIEKIVKSAHSNIENSKQKYTEAENLLLETLNLKDFQPNNEAVNIKTLKESFLQTGRLDAEFYQKKYEEIEQKIQNYIEGFAPLGKVCTLKDTNFTPNDNTEYAYIELSNIGNSGEIAGCTREMGINLPTRARRKVSENDVIVSSIEGSLKSCAIISKEYHNALCSTGFYVVASEQINAETLLVLFKSELMQQILKKNCSGTILTAINKEEFLNIPIPIIGKKYQEQIAEYIQKANQLRAEAQILLQEAKLSVENAIESQLTENQNISGGG